MTTEKKIKITISNVQAAARLLQVSNIQDDRADQLLSFMASEKLISSDK